MKKRMPAGKAVKRTFHDLTLVACMVCFALSMCWMANDLTDGSELKTIIVGAVSAFFLAVLRYMYGAPPEGG